MGRACLMIRSQSVALDLFKWIIKLLNPALREL